MNAIQRDRSLRVRIAPEELAMLHSLADLDGISASDWIRLTIRREHAKLAPQPKRAKRGKKE